MILSASSSDSTSFFVTTSGGSSLLGAVPVSNFGGTSLSFSTSLKNEDHTNNDTILLIYPFFLASIENEISSTNDIS